MTRFAAALMLGLVATAAATLGGCRRDPRPAAPTRQQASQLDDAEAMLNAGDASNQSDPGAVDRTSR